MSFSDICYMFYKDLCLSIPFLIHLYALKKGETKEGTKMASANKLTNAFIKTADVGKHLDGAGLFFRKA